MSKVLSNAEVEKLYKEFPEIEDPCYPKTEMVGMNESGDTLHLTLPSGEKYSIFCNANEEVWTLLK